MSEAILAKLDQEWFAAYFANYSLCPAPIPVKDFKKMGKILRMLINVLKSTDAGIKENEKHLAQKVTLLETLLPEMEFKTAIAVIGDLRHARKSLKFSSGQFGSAFKTKLDPKERARIRRRSKTPVLSVQNGSYSEKRDALRTVADDLLANGVDNGASELD
jgi:hypothetical protein